MSELTGLPTLSAGPHKAGTGRASVMEYVSLLAGENWSDKPDCTHPILTEAAQSVNDRLRDEDRYLLVPLIVRLFGTNAPVDEGAFLSLATKLRSEYFARYVTFPFDMPGVERSVQYLSDLIDIYDRLSGRNETHELTDADMKVLVSVGGESK